MGIEDQIENGEYDDTIYEEALLSPETIEKIVSNGYKKTFEFGKLEKEIKDTIVMGSTEAATFRIKPEPDKNRYIISLSSERSSDISTNAIKVSTQYGQRNKDF
jgi:hypothetical protein